MPLLNWTGMWTATLFLRSLSKILQAYTWAFYAEDVNFCLILYVLTSVFTPGILHTVCYTFSMGLTRRIYFTIRGFQNW